MSEVLDKMGELVKGWIELLVAVGRMTCLVEESQVMPLEEEEILENLEVVEDRLCGYVSMVALLDG